MPYGSSISVRGNKITINGTTITATAASSTSSYSYSFSGWDNATGTITGARTITANFTRTEVVKVYDVDLTGLDSNVIISYNGQSLSVGEIGSVISVTSGESLQVTYSGWKAGCSCLAINGIYAGNSYITYVYSGGSAPLHHLDKRFVADAGETITVEIKIVENSKLTITNFNSRAGYSGYWIVEDMDQDYDFVAYNGGYAISNYRGNSVNVEIPTTFNNKDVIKILDGTFMNNTTIKSVTIPDTVKEIDSYAFNGCSSLTSITIPSGVITINEWAFANCSNLKTVTIPNSLKEIKFSAFFDSAVSSIYYDGSISDWCGITFGNEDAYGWINSNWNLYINNVKQTNITIPNTVTAIPRTAFSYCYSLTNVIIGQNVTLIGDAAFERCGLLKSVYFYNNTNRKIGQDIFWQCPSTCVIYFEGTSARFRYTRYESKDYYLSSVGNYTVDQYKNNVGYI